MKIQNRQQLLVVLAGAAVVLFIGLNVILPPLQSWWTTRSSEIKDLRDRVKTGTFLLKREASLRGGWDNMRTNALPPNTSAAEAKLLTAVDGWSRDTGVEITSVMPQWKEADTNYLTLNCRVETAGDLGSLSRFLYQLEKGPMAVRVDSVELGAHDTSGQQMTMGLDLSGLVLVPNQ